LGKCSKRRRAFKVERGAETLGLVGRESLADLEDRRILRLETVFDVLVKLLVATSSLGRIEIASSDDMEVRSVEIEGRGDVLDVAEREVLGLVSRVVGTSRPDAQVVGDGPSW
jgi:hypothetical protein